MTPQTESPAPQRRTAADPTANAELGLAQLLLPTQGPYWVERVWVQRLDPARARILSVVRYSAPCQFGDIVLCERGRAGLLFLDLLESARYALHIVQGSPATPTQATALTQRLRENNLHIEVWSLTMRLPGHAALMVNADERAGTPLCAGLVLPASPLRLAEGESPSALLPNEAGRTAERAIRVLHGAARELGLSLYAPTLMTAAGDELGAARHRKALQRAAGGKCEPGPPSGE